MPLTPEKYLESWTAPAYWYADHKALVRSFLEDYRKAEAAAKAKADPYHGKSETLVLPEHRGTDRGIRNDRRK
jgi:hypothetical protein